MKTTDTFCAAPGSRVKGMLSPPSADTTNAELSLEISLTSKGASPTLRIVSSCSTLASSAIAPKSILSLTSISGSSNSVGSTP